MKSGCMKASLLWRRGTEVCSSGSKARLKALEEDPNSPIDLASKLHRRSEAKR